MGWVSPAAHEPLSRFYSAMPEMGSGFRPVEAADAYEAEQVVQREFPGAVTATLSERMTNKREIGQPLLD